MEKSRAGAGQHARAAAEELQSSDAGQQRRRTALVYRALAFERSRRPGTSGVLPLVEKQDIEHLSAELSEAASKQLASRRRRSGSHDHDGEWPDLSAAARDDDQRFWSRTRDALAALAEADVPAASRLDNPRRQTRHAGLPPRRDSPRRDRPALLLGAPRGRTRRVHHPRFRAGVRAGGEPRPAPRRHRSGGRRGARPPVASIAHRDRDGHPATKGLVALVDGGFPDSSPRRPRRRRRWPRRASGVASAPRAPRVSRRNFLPEERWLVSRRRREAAAHPRPDPRQGRRRRRAPPQRSRDARRGEGRHGPHGDRALARGDRLGARPDATTPAGKKAFVKGARPPRQGPPDERDLLGDARAARASDRLRARRTTS